jgi:hypothetical protein
MNAVLANFMDDVRAMPGVAAVAHRVDVAEHLDGIAYAFECITSLACDDPAWIPIFDKLLGIVKRDESVKQRLLAVEAALRPIHAARQRARGH